MNLLLLPIPDELLLEYLTPCEMVCLARVNKTCYETFKPLIFKATKRCISLSSSFFTKKLVEHRFPYSETYYTGQVYTYLGTGYTQWSVEFSPIVYFYVDCEISYFTLETRFKLLIEFTLKKMGIMISCDEFAYRGDSYCNRNRDLAITIVLSKRCARVDLYKMKPPEVRLCTFEFLRDTYWLTADAVIMSNTECYIAI